MKRYCLLGLIFLMPACASGKGFLSGMFTAKVADKVQVAEKVTGIEKADVKVADKVVAVDNSQANKTSVGGNLSNDSAVMKDYIQALKSTSKEQARLYEKVILGLIAQMGVLISLLGWCLKFLLKADERRDIREESKETVK
jgi:hypothetical protein